MKVFLLSLLIEKVALPVLKSGMMFAVKKLSKMRNGLTKDVSLAVLSPIVESMDNPIDGEDVIGLVKKLKG